MDNFKSLLDIAERRGIIDIEIKVKLVELLQNEYPGSDIYKKELIQSKKFNEDESSNALKMVFSISEVSDICGIAQRTILYYISSGKIHECEYRKSKGVYLLSKYAIDRILEINQTKD